MQRYLFFLRIQIKLMLKYVNLAPDKHLKPLKYGLRRVVMRCFMLLISVYVYDFCQISTLLVAFIIYTGNLYKLYW